MARGKLDNRRNYYRLLGTVYIMVLFGLVMVLSASSVRAYASMGDSYYYLKKQLIWVLIGTAMLLVFSRIRIKNLQKLAPYGIFIVIAMLIAVLAPGVGKSVGGASRWIPVAGFRLQPSEFAKLAVVIYTADFLARRKGRLNKAGDLVYPYGLIIALISVLVMKQPDLGTTLAICASAFTMIFIAGFRLRYIFAIGAMGLSAGAYLIYTASYRLKRFLAFLDPMADPLGAGYHIRQSLIAFGSGGLIGIGLGMSRQKYSYLPAAHTDFIFAIIGEELGLLGTLFTVLLFALFTYYSIKIAFGCQSTFGRLLASGLTSMVVLQALVNMGAVTAVLPITGIPMPFISYGGSSLMVNLASVGILLSIAHENEKRASSKKRKTPVEASKARSQSSSKPARSARSSSKSSSAKVATTRKSRTKTRSKKVNEGSDKRRRDSGSRVSRSSSRQSSAKNKGRS